MGISLKSLGCVCVCYYIIYVFYVLYNTYTHIYVCICIVSHNGWLLYIQSTLQVVTDMIPHYSLYKHNFFFPRKMIPSTVEISKQNFICSTHSFLEE